MWSKGENIMSVYDSAEKYAEHLNMTLEQAKVRLEYFSKVKEEMKATRKCPKCGEYSLAVEGGEWECGVPDWVYCANDKIEKIDEEGDKYFDECDFTDDVESKYLFAFEHDFDAVLMMSCGLDINNEQEVLNAIGCSWNEFVEKDTNDFVQSHS